MIRVKSLHDRVTVPIYKNESRVVQEAGKAYVGASDELYQSLPYTNREEWSGGKPPLILEATIDRTTPEMVQEFQKILDTPAKPVFGTARQAVFAKPPPKQEQEDRYELAQARVLSDWSDDVKDQDTDSKLEPNDTNRVLLGQMCPGLLTFCAVFSQDAENYQEQEDPEGKA